MLFNTHTIILASLGGILPALFWLWFWLKEDRLHPEPKQTILATFLAGIFIVPIAFYSQKYTEPLFSGNYQIICWSFIEEILKLGAAYFVAIRSKNCDEPIDPMIYLITAALGFSAIENTLFIINDISTNNLLSSLVTVNLRFIGASLLHVLASGAIGVFIAFSFESGKISKFFHAIFGLFVAVTFHSIFNIFIMKSNNWGAFMVFCFVWVSIFMLLAAFEKVKNLGKIRL
jgi:RsiW-degrading membrane proteinase PrsW (M82 family)